MANVTFDQVYKRFDEVVAVNNLNLEVEDKEFLVLVGPSGCGKSTALRLLAGLEDISEGTLKISDRVVNDVAPKDRDIAMVFQSYALYPHMSVYDNMAFGLKLRKYPKEQIEERVQKAAEILGITTLLERKPRQLSGGQRQRVALGRAIVREPQVFLLDEPLSNLDAKLRVQTRAEITKLHQKLETTFIYVTHDQVEAMTMASRIAVMNHGVLMQVDSPQNLYDSPNNLFVAGFIGSPAMNFFNADIAQEGDDIVVKTNSFAVKVPENRRGALKPYVGKSVVFGLRPEDIHDPNFAPPRIVSQTIEAEVDLTELMGNEIFLFLKSDDNEYVARVDPRTSYKMGDKVKMAFNMDNMHVFDKETEQVIK
jgi:multiple sugar transport system ATP-binding protein